MGHSSSKVVYALMKLANDPGEPVSAKPVSYLDALMKPANDPEEPVEATPFSYFDSVPIEVPASIVRQLSESPGSKRWLTSLDHTDVFTVLQTNAALGTAARETFTDTRIGLSSSPLHSVDVVSTFFMNKQAPRLQSLSIDDWGSRFRFLDSSSMGRCMNLRKLTLDEDIRLYFNYGKFDSLFEALSLIHI